MRLLLVALIATMLTACGGTSGDTANDTTKAKTESAELQLVRERYGDCLTKLDAKVDGDGPRWVSFDTKGNGYLVIGVAKLANGKTATAPKGERDIALLESVGC